MGNPQGSRWINHHLGSAQQRRAFWESHREELYDMYVNKRMGIQEIADVYGLYKDTVYHALRRLDIPRRHVRYNAKYTLDPNYFDCIDTPEKAYVLGFITADGHVSSRGVIMFTQHKKE